MTDQRDLKRRVRDRMAKTGESYTAARKHILDQRERAAEAPAPAFDVIDPVDLTEPAAALGFKCHVFAFPALVARVSTTVVLEKLRDALFATEDDPLMKKLRASAFRGEVPPGRTWQFSEDLEQVHRFVRRAKAGLGGVSPGGTLLALHVAGEVVLCALTTYRVTRDAEPRPSIWLHSVDESIGTVKIAGLLMR